MRMGREDSVNLRQCLPGFFAWSELLALGIHQSPITGLFRTEIVRLLCIIKYNGLTYVVRCQAFRQELAGVNGLRSVLLQFL